jgi:outer membrane receptor for monomeric catechols
VAYNWRDTFARSNSTNGGAIGTVPLYDKAFGWMDASLSYSVNKHLKVSLDVANVLRTHRESYFKETVFQNEDVIEDRQFYLSATWKL